MAAWEIIRAEAQHVPLIAQLYREVYGTTTPDSYLHWRYFENPLDAATVMIAHDRTRDRLAGLSAALPVTLSLGEHRARGAQAVDSMTHPDYRQQGVFTALAAASMERLRDSSYAVMYGFPNAQAIGSFVRQLNWDFTGRVALRKRWVFPAHAALNTLLLSSHSPRGECRAGVPESAAIDAFFAGLAPEPRTTRIVRDAAWLHWRYHAASRREARWHGLYDTHGALIGLAIWNHGAGARFGSIAELWAQDGRDYAVLLHAILREAASLRLRSLCSYVAQPALARTLWRCGFIADPRPATALSLCVRSLGTHTYPSNIHTHSDWRIMGGDVDFL